MFKLSTSTTRVFLFVVYLAALLNSCTNVEAKDGLIEKTFADEQKNWKQLENKLKEQRADTCSYLLAEVNRDGTTEVLTLDKVTTLLETALEHLAAASAHFQNLLPYVQSNVVDDFDQKGRAFVLELSLTRSRLIEDYKSAEQIGSDGEILKRILETAFFKACSFKLATIVMEQQMYESASKYMRAAAKRPSPRSN